MESVLLLLWLLFLPHMDHQGHATKCSRNDPLNIPQEWIQPGDFLIGGIATHIYYLTPSYSFTKHPSQEQANNVLL